jgi:DNA-binding XRE family transcriptional regulator
MPHSNNIILNAELAESLSDLEQHRRDLGMTQVQAGRLVGASPHRLRRLEVEAPISRDTVRMALVYTAFRELLGLPPLPPSNGRGTV